MRSFLLFIWPTLIVLFVCAFGLSKDLQGSICQPYFNIRPTGEGTSLGLLLRYHMTDVHGREVKAETKAKNLYLSLKYLCEVVC